MFRSAGGFCLVLALFVFGATAQSSMRLDRNVVYFDPSDPDRQDVVVQNPDAEPMYLEVEVMQVVHPGTPDEQLIKVRGAREAGLLVSPNKLVVPAGGRKLLRFVNLAGRGDEERIYRVNVTPKLGEIKATAAAVKKLVEDAKDLSRNAPDLDKVMEMLILVRGMHEEGSLTEARRLLQEISKIVKSLPKEGVEAITALAQELKP